MWTCNEQIKETKVKQSQETEIIKGLQNVQFSNVVTVAFLS